jgi:hypothetical protein
MSDMIVELKKELETVLEPFLFELADQKTASLMENAVGGVLSKFIPREDIEFHITYNELDQSNAVFHPDNDITEWAFKQLGFL